MSFKPDPLDFGNKTRVGKTAKKKLSITNTSPANVDVTITGETAAAPFGVKTQCMKTLTPGQTCKVEVTFTPPDTNPQIGKLVVMDNATNAPQSVTLMGTGK